MFRGTPRDLRSDVKEVGRVVMFDGDDKGRFLFLVMHPDIPYNSSKFNTTWSSAAAARDRHGTCEIPYSFFQNALELSGHQKTCS